MKHHRFRAPCRHHRRAMTLHEWHAYKELEKKEWHRVFASLDLMLAVISILPRYFGTEPPDTAYKNED